MDNLIMSNIGWLMLSYLISIGEKVHVVRQR
nr:MAG TPA: hypothetical protein [Caudoviricetes sp.]DAX07246.1 MAG TPA: hypothetical protein [Bacteriophage sp.]DAZ43680.1 MAG TPA: hypothetical protein [Caudoviricetes sp.]